MRKHCTMSELLAVRDGEGTAWARAHVDDCAFCREELDLLYRRVAALRALPVHRPPRDRWTVIRAQAVRERRGRVLRRSHVPVLWEAPDMRFCAQCRGTLVSIRHGPAKAKKSRS